MEISAVFWNVDHEVKFRLQIGTYENIMTFLESHKIEFLSEMGFS